MNRKRINPNKKVDKVDMKVQPETVKAVDKKGGWCSMILGGLFVLWLVRMFIIFLALVIQNAQ